MKKYRALLPIAIVTGLAACSERTPGAAAAATATGTATAAAPAAVDVGARIFNGNCLPCHQQNGHGIPGVYPSLAGSPVVLGDPAALALWVIKGQRPASMPVGRYSTTMLQFGWMKDRDAAALFTYVRSNFGNSAPPVDAATVAKALGR